MTLRQYLSVMIVGTVIAGATLALMIILVNPDQAGPVSVAALLVAIMLCVTGVLSVIGVVARVHVLRRPGVVSRQVRTSFRQGALLAVLVVLALLLSHLRLFAWWNIMLALGALGVAEYFFLSSEGTDFETADSR